MSEPLGAQVLDYQFADAHAIRRDVAGMLRPPRRTSVSQVAAETVRVTTAGGGSAAWDPSLTPYMVRPMDCLGMRRYEDVVFVGPARAGKTFALLDCMVAYGVLNDPGDTLIVQMTEKHASDFSKRRIDRLLRNSPALRESIRLNTHDDNVQEKRFRNGTLLSLGWPTDNQLSGRDIRNVLMTDFDAFPQSLGKQGSTYLLAKQRTLTFRSAGMTLAESSPRFDITDPEFRPSTPHELPPVTAGVCVLYNGGTRELWYWPCEDCGAWFVPDFPDAFTWSIPEAAGAAEPTREADWTDQQIADAVGAARFTCPHCGVLHDPALQRELNRAGDWYGDGQVGADGHLAEGWEPAPAKRASFRLPGGAAAYRKPSELVEMYLRAERVFARTGSEEDLRAVIQLNTGRPYLPRLLRERRGKEGLMDRAEAYEMGVVPAGVRYLLASIDVQAHHFAVLVEGFGEHLERWLIDRFDVRFSPTRTTGGDRDLLDPASHLEDWDVLIEEVLGRSYPLGDGSGRRMLMKLTGGDSGGRDGVTTNSYQWWRGLAKRRLQHRFVLLKGHPRKGAPRVRKTEPEPGIDLYLLNSDELKDTVANELEREHPGPGYIHLPADLPAEVFSEITAEVRDPRTGKWSSPARERNETWDLMQYTRAVAIVLNAEQIDWANPPGWAQPWDTNTLVIAPDGDDGPPLQRLRAPRRRRGVRVLNRGL